MGERAAHPGATRPKAETGGGVGRVARRIVRSTIVAFGVLWIVALLWMTKLSWADEPAGRVATWLSGTDRTRYASINGDVLNLGRIDGWNHGGGDGSDYSWLVRSYCHLTAFGHIEERASGGVPRLVGETWYGLGGWFAFARVGYLRTAQPIQTVVSIRLWIAFALGLACIASPILFALLGRTTRLVRPMLCVALLGGAALWIVLFATLAGLLCLRGPADRAIGHHIRGWSYYYLSVTDGIVTIGRGPKRSLGLWTAFSGFQSVPIGAANVTVHSSPAPVQYEVKHVAAFAHYPLGEVTSHGASMDFRASVGHRTMMSVHLGLLGPIGALWLLLAARFMGSAIRRIRRRPRGQCPSCGYNLFGNLSGVCPECGEARGE
jgi:hypothetical protein